MSARKLWVVSPCFFDAGPFRRLHGEARKALEPLGLETSFVLVDDSAGQDPDVASLASLGDVRIVALPYNMGHQAALVYALRRLAPEIAAEDLVVTMDSDGEDRPEDLPVLLRPLLAEPANLNKIAIARRTRRSESLAFKVLYFGFKLLFRLLAGTVVRNGNFVAFRGWFLKELIHHPHFDQCYASTFVSLPLQAESVPLPRGPRYAGTSKMGYMGLLTHGVRMLMPFSERIAVRGMAGSFVALKLASLAFLAGLFLRLPLLALLSAFAVLLSALSLGLFALLFATFSQTKARALRDS